MKASLLYTGVGNYSSLGFESFLHCNKKSHTLSSATADAIIY